MLDEELSRYTILPEFLTWALEVLNSQNDMEIQTRQKIYENQYNTLESFQTQLDNLTRMRYRELITDEEYLGERKSLQDQILKLRSNVQTTEKRTDDWLELTEKTFEFATYARVHFNKGDINTKREIVRALGSNPIIKAGKVRIEAYKWLAPIKESYSTLENQYKRIELSSRCEEAKNKALSEIRLSWGHLLDAFLNRSVDIIANARLIKSFLDGHSTINLRCV